MEKNLGGLFTCFLDDNIERLIVDPGLLEGISGIGMALLPEEEHEWTTVLML